MGKYAVFTTPCLQGFTPQTTRFMQCHQLLLGRPILRTTLFGRQQADHARSFSFHPTFLPYDSSH